MMVTKSELLDTLNWLISLEYSFEYIFNSFIFATKSSPKDSEELKENKEYLRKMFLHTIKNDAKYIELEKINQALIYYSKRKKGNIDIDEEKEKLIKKLQKSRNNIKNKGEYFKLNNILDRAYAREARLNRAKKGIELDISGNEEIIDRSYRFTMPHNKNTEYQYYSFTSENYEELEELCGICHFLRNKRKLTKGERKEKKYFEWCIDKILKEATIIDCDKKELSEIIIKLSKLESKKELTEVDKATIDKLRSKKDELERKIKNRILY